MNEHVSVPRMTHPWVTEGQHTVRFGVAILDQRADWSVFYDSVQMAEELGFDSYWTYDHPRWSADCWTTLAALAVASKTIRLGPLVSCIYYRSPIMLARMAADVDRWSHGRLILGVGTGWAQDEFAQLSLSFPSTSERQQALEEAIQVVMGLWGESPYTFQGQYYQVKETNVWPAPVQQPHVPILLAGGGERVTLRQVAQYADVSNFAALSQAGSAFELEDVQRKFEVLRSNCQSIGRPYESVLRSYLTLPLVLAETPRALQAKLDAIPEEDRAFYQTSLTSGTPGEVIEHYQSLIDAGVQYFIVVAWERDLETIQLFAEQVVPVLTRAHKA